LPEFEEWKSVLEKQIAEAEHRKNRATTPNSTPEMKGKTVNDVTKILEGLAKITSSECVTDLD